MSGSRIFNAIVGVSFFVAGVAALSAAEPVFYRIQDPVANAMEACADGRVTRADAALKILAEKSPGDADVWVAWCLVSEEGSKLQQAKLCRQQVLELLPKAEALHRLQQARARLDERKAEILAEKEAKGLIPYRVVTPIPTPGQRIWSDLERERREARRAPTPTARELSEGPRLLRKKANNK